MLNLNGLRDTCTASATNNSALITPARNKPRGTATAAPASTLLRASKIVFIKLQRQSVCAMSAAGKVACICAALLSLAASEWLPQRHERRMTSSSMPHKQRRGRHQHAPHNEHKDRQQRHLFKAARKVVESTGDNGKRTHSALLSHASHGIACENITPVYASGKQSSGLQISAATSKCTITPISTAKESAPLRRSAPTHQCCSAVALRQRTSRKVGRWRAAHQQRVVAPQSDARWVVVVVVVVAVADAVVHVVVRLLVGVAARANQRPRAEARVCGGATNTYRSLLMLTLKSR